ncbi:hypothetical protein Droror1_Dr00003858 [Drosera rotundifolia]
MSLARSPSSFLKLSCTANQSPNPSTNPNLQLARFSADSTTFLLRTFFFPSVSMKGATRWSDDEDEDEDEDSSSEDKSSNDEETGSDYDERGSSKRIKQSGGGVVSAGKSSEVKSGKKRSGAIDFEALRQHGYKGGLSVLSVPPPKNEDDQRQDWSWSTGKERPASEKDKEESYAERQKTRAAIADAEELQTAMTRKAKKEMGFSQKEKRKRDLGQASRAKNYVEEEKRLLRDRGIYSGFDS